ncbi:MAG: hypothetical protein WC437_04935 [Patescibacteria group bacterium]|jgi:hypothetical protein
MSTPYRDKLFKAVNSGEAESYPDAAQKEKKRQQQRLSDEEEWEIRMEAKYS